MNNYLKRMYNSESQSATPSEKNPNRVSGGLKAQGQDSFTMLGEDGHEKEVPSQRYVRSLEEQVRKLKEDQGLMQRKMARQDTNVQRLSAIVDQIKNRRS
jgi:hypothetical protein